MLTSADAMVETSWDRLGRRTFVSQPYFLANPIPEKPGLTTAYDRLDRPISETPDSTFLGATTYTYDTVNGVTIVDGRGKTRTIVVDSAGRPRLSTETNGADSVTTRQYFTYFGLPAGAKDASGNRVTIAYDTAGRRLSVDDPDAGKTTFTTNAFGEVVKEVDAMGGRLFEFDKLGRITKRSENDVEVANYVWDMAENGTGQIWRTVSYADGVESQRAYDSLGRPASTEWTVGTEKFKVDTGFDTAGRLGTITYPPGADGARPQVSYQYSQVQDRGAELTKVLRGTTTLWQLVALDASDRAIEFTVGNQARTSMSYYHY